MRPTATPRATASPAEIATLHAYSLDGPSLREQIDGPARLVSVEADDTSGTALEISRRRPGYQAKTDAELEAMTAAELDALLETIDARPPCPPEWDRVWGAMHAAEFRELREWLMAAAEEEPMALGAAAWMIPGVSRCTALLPWIYKGKLTGTKVPRGPRGFYWTVPAGEVRRYMLERDRLAAEQEG